MINHMCLKISDRVKDFVALFTWNFLFFTYWKDKVKVNEHGVIKEMSGITVIVVDVIIQPRIAVKSFVAVWTFVFTLTVMNITCKANIDFSDSRITKLTYEYDFLEFLAVRRTFRRSKYVDANLNACESCAFSDSLRLSGLMSKDRMETLFETLIETTSFKIN